MLDRVFSEIGLEAPPKPRDFVVPPAQLKSEVRNDTGLPTDPVELLNDLGLPRNPKELTQKLGIPQLQEFSPKKMFGK